MDCLKWDYGALDDKQEELYIEEKMEMQTDYIQNEMDLKGANGKERLTEELSFLKIEYLVDMIARSQREMRKYAFEQLKLTTKEREALKGARSCVSQRDIQRVFTLSQWLQNLYFIAKRHRERRDNTRRALLVSLGVVYYMRLNLKYREKYKTWIDEKYRSKYEISFSEALTYELEWFIANVELPIGIAQTQALMENLFATIVCTANRIPLIIVGAPGSSKTLSFNLAVSNLKGQESKKQLFRETKVFHSLDPHFYQCSRRTTSNEIETVFSRAVNRQQTYTHFSLPINCVVLMDEAGLPEESHESLKVLHYHLDCQKVSFVAITNHMLDAAKSNRAVSLFRPEATDDDLIKLARGCLTSQQGKKVKEDLHLVERTCKAFSQIMEKEDLRHFFGLRDFVHFINYLRRKRHVRHRNDVVMEAIERNFNGSGHFDVILKTFLHTVSLIRLLP